MNPLHGDLLRFVALAYAISWLGVSPLVAAARGLVGPMPAALHAVGAMGPILAAFIVARRSGAHRALWRSTFRRLPPRPWLRVAMASPFALLGAATLGVAAFGSAPLDWARLGDAALQPAWWGDLVIASVVYGFGEEPGWRGFALPRLQERLPAWSATLALNVVWAAWHAPMFLYRYSFGEPGAFVGFFISLLAGAFWLTFLFNSSRGSVLAVALWHAGWNVANLIAAAMGTPVVVVLNALMMVLGFGVLLTGPRHLSASGERIRSGAPVPPIAPTAA